ncbi:putative scaffolding protein [Mycobacterium phage C3]|nr:putative scaffolding protein [Mycobacterium phage C3]
MSDTPVSTDGSTPEGNPVSKTDTPLEPTPKTYDEAYVKELRQEAAAARVAKKDAVEKAVNDLKAEHAAELAARDTAYTELQNQLGQAWIELEKLYTTIDAKVPSDKVRAFVSILQGDDKESIQASAKSAYELAGGFNTKTPAFDPSQGTGGRDPLPLNGDPILNAMKNVLKIK